MAEKYVTLAEAAELEGVKYNTMVQRYNRGSDKFKVKTIKNGNGGKDAVMVAVSSLSKPARQAWREKEKLKELARLPEPDEEEKAKPDRPWYVDEDLDWYISTYPEKYYKAVELGNVIREFLRYGGAGDKTTWAEEFAQERIGKGARTLYRYVKTYLTASAWADKLTKETGNDYEYLKVLCLCRKPKEAGIFPSIPPEMKQCIKNIWFNKDFAQNHGTMEMLYYKLGQVAAVNEWEKVPSYQTVTRYINHMMEDENMRNAHFLVAEGRREYRNKVMHKGARDTSKLKVMEIVMGDEHTFDAWCSYKQPNGKVIAIRPKLVAWIDVRSRTILGDILCKDGNSDILKQSMLKMIFSDPGGVPEYIYIDNGKDYTAKTMTGVNRKARNAHLVFDNEAHGFYQSIGIKDYHRAKPYEPWSKTQIERSFRTVCNQFTRWFKSYTGTLTGSKTSEKRDKDIQRMLKNGELLTIEEFYERWHQWLTEVYYHKTHRGLKAAGEEYATPYEVFTREDRYEKPAPPKSYCTMLMMKEDGVRVYTSGIRRWEHWYYSPELDDYQDKKLAIKWDPDDVSVIYVFDKNGRKICDAECQELLDFAPGVPQKALEEHIRNQNRQLKRDAQKAKEAQIPFEEIYEGYVGFSSTAGGIELMIGNKRKKGEVVAFPEDRTWQQGFRKKEAAKASEYINSKGQDALKKLRAMNE